MNRPTSSRLLSTSARVHPSYLPYLHNASRNGVKGVKWYPAPFLTQTLPFSRGY